ncbi:hypothetical protein BBP00_00007124 [Phytophthora kernoviae]|uniref:Uncharacterized protein n=1 Tax=Phytophthora kernoviae TaxID=325452 RepID=A0A3F2RJ40_9STRA|nr:hypothetical protein BBP00_00007124 [Phytophthora kernoviae]
MIVPYQCLLASALTASVVNGHGWMTKPEATFSASAGDKTQFVATIESSSTGFEGSYNSAPADNVAFFTKAFKASSYKSLKALIDDKAKITVSGATLTCGSADPSAAPQPLPSTLEWSHSDSEGFTPSHEGPCEAWCDDTRVFQDENCSANFPAAPAEMPYESSSCSGASKLTFYWIAMHGPSWQVYVNCAALSGSGGGGTTQTNESECGSYDVAGGSSDDAQYNQGSNTANTQSSNTGKPNQNLGTASSTNEGTNQYWGGATTSDTNQYNQGSNTANTYQGSATNAGSTNYGFNSFQNQGWTNAGTVSP